MSEINEMIRKIRGKDSLRTATKKTGISYTYWSILEKGVDPRTKSPIKPSPDTLRAIANGYHYPYEELMVIAGYMNEEEKGSVYALPDNIYESIIKEAEKHYGVNLHDDPVVYSAIKQMIDIIAQTKVNNKE